MENSRLVARNVIWNWAGMAAVMAAGVVVMPFLIHRLGDETYGLWILIGSVTNYFGLLDLGIRGSVGRYIAFYRAKNDQDGINRSLSTAIIILCAVGTLALLGTLAIIPFFGDWFDVPAEQLHSVRLTLLLVGINLALTLPLSAFDGTLWAFQRFDLLNMVDIPAIVVRTGLTFLWIANGGELVALGILTLATTLGTGLGKALLSFREDRALRLVPRIEKAAALELFIFGFWSFLQGVTYMVTTQMGILITGAWLAVSAVTTYSIALRLVNIVQSCLIACTGVLTPLATTLHAGDKHDQQQRLFLTGGRLCTAFTLYFVILLVFLGKPLIVLWIGPSQIEAARLLTILALGHFLSFAQRVTFSMILGMGRHKFMALVGLGQSVLATVLAVLAVPAFGLAGVALAFVTGDLLGHGVIQLLYGCKLTHVRVRHYLQRSLLAPMAVAAGPALGLVALTNWWMPDSWPGLILSAAAFSICYGGVVYWFLLRPEMRQPPMEERVTEVIPSEALDVTECGI
jgi:O-antigen/teichoic acid export membrane protein